MKMIFGDVEDDDATDDAAYAYDDDKTSIYDDQFEKEYGDDFFEYNDGSNPCLGNPHYYIYLISTVFSHSQGRNWDYILLNDNTRSAAQEHVATRELVCLGRDISSDVPRNGGETNLSCDKGVLEPIPRHGGTPQRP